MEFNLNQLNVVRGYFEERFKTMNVVFVKSTDNEAVATANFLVNEVPFFVSYDREFNLYMSYKKGYELVQMNKGFSLMQLENRLYENKIA